MSEKVRMNLSLVELDLGGQDKQQTKKKKKEALLKTVYVLNSK